VRVATDLAPPQLSLDVAINRARRVTAVFAGSLTETHDAACAHVGAAARREVEAPYDLVVSTNGGHPLDRNLYQSVKGMAAADRVRQRGGTVVMAAACADGVPDDGAFARLLAESRSPEDLIASTAGPELDRWQAQVLGRVLARGTVRLYSDALAADAIRMAQLVPAPDLDGAVGDTLAGLGPTARVAVLPEGPLTVATVRM
jgi:nickel-dependent lactate racemase